MSKFILAIVAGVVFFFAASREADAQYRYYSNRGYSSGYSSPHYHDAAGHRVDGSGHHVDLAGRHTGTVGIYDNGQVDYSSQTYYAPRYSDAYEAQYLPQYGYAPQAYAPQVAPQNSIPQNNVVFRPTSVARTGEPIVISLPKEITQDVNYAVNGFVFSIRPGFAQKLADDRTWVIAFGSGGSKGDVRYTLAPGKYNFTLTTGGWDLVKEKDVVPANQLPPPTPPEESK